MITLEATRIGNMRIRLVEQPAEHEELAAPHYVVCDHVAYRAVAAIAYAGYSFEQARRQWTYYVEREQARVAADQDDGR